MKKGAVLWTGGKDCALALYRAVESGFDVACLVTFVPAGEAFKAHPTAEMKIQADKLSLPIYFLPVTEPFFEGYKAQLKMLQNEYGIEAVVTGDIDLVDGQPNWISQCCEDLKLVAVFPLWKETRLKLLNELLARKIKAKISWINHPEIPPSWLGRCLDASLLKELMELNKNFGIDMSGENGEYHTMVTEFPYEVGKGEV